MTETTCRSCGHDNPHTGPAGDVNDACMEPRCSCAWYVPGPPDRLTREEAARRLTDEVMEIAAARHELAFSESAGHGHETRMFRAAIAMRSVLLAALFPASEPQP